MAFTAQDVKTLREKGLAKAAKKAGRIAAEGLVSAAVYGNTAVALEINTETDFVAKNAEFVKFVEDISKLIAEKNPQDVEALKAEKLYGDQTVGDALTEKIATIGENMNLRRFARYEGVNVAYVHGGGRIGVLVNFKLGDESKAETDAFKAAAKDVAMQVAAAMPQYLNKDEVPSDVIEKEKEILRVQALNEGKPEAIVDKMVMGRIQKFYKEVCLVEQEYIKDPDMSVTKFLNGVASEIGTDIEIVKFTRFEKGEGLEKKEENFAEEVAKMMGN